MSDKKYSFPVWARPALLKVDIFLFIVVQWALGKLSRHARYRMLLSLSKHYHIESVVVRGASGRAEGDLRDQGVFRRYLEERVWSEHILQLIKARMAGYEHGTYIDIGANIGLTTIPLAIGSSWNFFAFEPDPTNFRRLRLNLLRNSVESVVARNVALSDAVGTLTLRKSPNNFGDFRLEREGGGSGMDWADDRYKETEWEAVEVQTSTLDGTFAGAAFAGPMIVKIDTQGAEPFILKGGTEILAKAELVIMEFWPYGIARQGTDPIKFIDDLKGLFGSVQVISAASGEPLGDSFDVVSRLTAKIVAGSPTDYFDLVLTNPTRPPK
jgi:FkbM family methyltransferase